jgi:glycosyltransferase involved in cell wall biosynthesis
MVNTGFLPVPPDKGGSVELHSYYLSNELAKLGSEIHFVTGVNPEASFHQGVILHKLPWIPFNFHGNYFQMLLSFGIGGSFAFMKSLKAINNEHFDIIHIHGHVSGFCLLPLNKKAKFIFTAHNPNPWMVESFSQFKQIFRELAFRSIELKIIRNVDCVITVGKSLKNEFVNRFKVCPEKVKIIPNGVDTDLFHPNIIGSEDVLTRYHLPEDYILFVGRLVEQKGIQFLLKAIKGTRINVVIVGGGPLFSYLKDLCQRLDIVERVHFIGSIPLNDLRKIYSQAKFFVLPSIAEGFPLVGLEAIASGLPLVVSKIKGIEDIVIDEYNGILFNVGNVNELRCCLNQLFEDNSLAKVMGVRSRKIAEDKFSWREIAKQTLRLYEEIL